MSKSNKAKKSPDQEKQAVKIEEKGTALKRVTSGTEKCTLSISGYGYIVRWRPLKSAEVKRVIRDGLTYDEFQAMMADCKSEFGPAQCSVYVDDVKVKEVEASSPARRRTRKGQNWYLVQVYSNKGLWLSREFNTGFDKRKLKHRVVDFKLNQTGLSYLQFEYDGEVLEADYDLDCKQDERFMINPKGKFFDWRDKEDDAA